MDVKHRQCLYHRNTLNIYIVALQLSQMQLVHLFSSTLHLMPLFWAWNCKCIGHMCTAYSDSAQCMWFVAYNCHVSRDKITLLCSE